MSNDFAVNMDDLLPSAPTYPAADYHLKIVSAEGKETQAGGGKYISYRAVIQSGDYAGKSLFGMWTIKPAAGKQDMSYITRQDWKRLGIAGIQDPSDLIGVEGYAKVTEGAKKDESGEPTEERENRIKSWKGPAA